MTDTENLLLDFEDYLRKDRNLSQTDIDNFIRTARQYISFAQGLPTVDAWFVWIREEKNIAFFLEKQFNEGSEKTLEQKKLALKFFSTFLKHYGKLSWCLAFWNNIKRKPHFIILSMLIAILGFIVDFHSLLSIIQQAINVQQKTTATITSTSTHSLNLLMTEQIISTSTITLENTATITPSITPSQTPTPNQTQIFLSTNLPTADPNFITSIRELDEGSQQVWIPDGAYVAGDLTGVGFPDESPHQVYTDGFWIDRYLVTNNDFDLCPENVCGRPQQYISHKRPKGYYGVVEYHDFPVIEITWVQAQAYCQWKNGRLPTEAEWEKAAGWNPRTGESFIYPWGNQPPDKSLANYDNVDKDTSPINEYILGMNSFGMFDMAGNVWQWIFDWYGYYPDDSLINPHGPSFGNYRVIRGGSWANTTLPTYLRVANRGKNQPMFANNEIGFRCVFDN